MPRDLVAQPRELRDDLALQDLTRQQRQLARQQVYLLNPAHLERSLSLRTTEMPSKTLMETMKEINEKAQQKVMTSSMINNSLKYDQNSAEYLDFMREQENRRTKKIM